MAKQKIGSTIQDLAVKTKDVNAIANTGVVLAGAVTAVITVVDKITDHVEDRIPVPELYLKKYPLTYKQAETLLIDSGFKMLATEIKKPNVRFKDCFEYQVVGSKPKQRHKEKPGTTVIVMYVTQDIIDASKKLFEEHERQKAEEKQQKANERIVKKEEVKQMIIERTDKAKEQIKNTVNRKRQNKK